MSTAKSRQTSEKRVQVAAGPEVESMMALDDFLDEMLFY
jgi:hypothetical protein